MSGEEYLVVVNGDRPFHSIPTVEHWWLHSQGSHILVYPNESMALDAAAALAADVTGYDREAVRRLPSGLVGWSDNTRFKRAPPLVTGRYWIWFHGMVGTYPRCYFGCRERIVDNQRVPNLDVEAKLPLYTIDRMGRSL